MMTMCFKKQMSEIFQMAWQFVKRNGYTMSEALKVAWMNYKLRSAMMSRIIKFYFQKVDGTMREAYGCLIDGIIPKVDGTRRTNDTCQTYFDTEKNEWRCFKKANLVRIA